MTTNRSNLADSYNLSQIGEFTVSPKVKIIILTLITTLFAVSNLYPCTSFMFQNDNNLYFVHSLNQGNVPSVPGQVFFNPAKQWKAGFSWERLIKVSDTSQPDLIWQSKYSSVTFNPFGLNLPDGGMNDDGLFIWEMGFDTKYPVDSSKPTLFQAEWMMYQLDNYATVDELLANLDRVNLDGWGWHYFVADKSGNSAIIDFIDGKAVVHTELEIPLCCNSSYPEAIKQVHEHPGLGDDFKITKDSREMDRFVYGADLFKRYTDQNPVDYCFYMLDEMSINVRWAVVYDVTRNRAYFKTNLNQSVKEIDMTALSNNNQPMTLNIEQAEGGEVTSKFEPYQRVNNQIILHQVFSTMCEAYSSFKKELLDDQHTTLENFVTSVNNKINQPVKGK